MTSLTQELRQDAEEMRKLLASAQRQRVKDILTIELRKMETEITLKAEAAQKQESSQATAKPVSTQPRLQTTDVKNYAWDQSEKFVKIYATIPGVDGVPQDNIKCSFHHRSFSLRCEDVKGKNYTCEVTTLMEEILPGESLFKIKTDMILVMLKKKEAGKTWPFVTQTEKKIKDKPMKTPAVNKDADPNDSLMTLMKQMYDDGDDDMKRTIAKAWTESRDKQGKGDMAL